MISELDEQEQLRRAALAALSNALGLYKDAELLFNHERFPRALSLSILADEEVGKGLLFTLAALNRVHGLRDELRQASFRNPAKRHPLKQLLVEVAGFADEKFSEYQSIVGSLVGEPVGARDPIAVVEALLEQTAEWLTEALADPDYSQRQYRLRKGMVAQLPFVARGDVRPYQTPEEAKWSGLYVDFTTAGLQEPASVTRREAESALLGFLWGHGAVHRLHESLDDDELWNIVVSTCVH